MDESIRSEILTMECQIRRATSLDAEAISEVTINALRKSSAQDYPPEVIARLEHNFSTQAIHRLMMQRKVFVAVVDEQVVATASLDGAVVRSVFVEPGYQGKGIGKQLMVVIHAAAIDASLELLHVPSSITAETFYVSMGYQKVRDEFFGDERTIVMCKRLLE
jgi:N-acetylglutamate synthase-like GNAT family acetyltransferase